MRSERIRMRRAAAAMTLIALAIVLFVSAGTSYGDETISVSCYQDSRRIGSITTFEWQSAAAACNSFFYDCRGWCIGCFYDSDYVEAVCVNNNGTVFLR